MARLRAVAILLSVALLASAGCTGCTNTGPGGPKGGGEHPRLNGAGATFIYPMMTKWMKEYEQAKGIKVDYQSIGSGGGIKQMTAKTVDFGCSDGPMNDAQLKEAHEQGGDVVHIPLVMGAVVPAYNLPSLKDKQLKFSGPVLADIFLGNITQWNDPAIQKLNPGVELPGTKIVVVHRSDGSGTTYIFVDFLCKVSDEWEKKVGKATSVNWPTGLGEKGNENVAGQVKRSEGAIGYIELTYAWQQKDKIQYGKAKNAENEFVLASPESVTKAADNFVAAKKVPDDLRYNLANAPGKGSYPIAGTTWAFMYVNQKGNTAQGLKDFFTYVLTDGQKGCAELGYAPLPESLAKMAQEKVKRVTVK